MAKMKGNTGKRGFASMPRKRLKQISSKGGRASRGQGRSGSEKQGSVTSQATSYPETWDEY